MTKKTPKNKRRTKAQLQKAQDNIDIQALKEVERQHSYQLKEKIFVNEYLLDFNGTRAAIKAGYSKNKNAAGVQAARLLRNAKVQKAINDRIDERMKSLSIDQNFVIKSLLDIHNRCIQAEPVLDSNGTPTGEYKFDSKAANVALGMIGKHLNMFPTTLRNDPNNPVDAAKTIIYLPNNGR